MNGQKEGVPLKTVSLRSVCSIIEGKLVKGRTDTTVSSVNYGRPKYVRRHQLYFFGKKTSFDKQYAAVKQVKPLAVVIPSRYRHLSFPAETAVIQVSDPYRSFWRLGLWNFRQHPVKTVAITGSAGKSTTTSMVASVLKRRYPIVKTEGNLNTASFLPTYLCRLSSKHRVLLLEMGMKSLGNIARQCRVVRPQVGAVTNVGEAHYGSVGGAHNIVKAKQELIDGMRDGGVVWLNADNDRSRKLRTEHVNVSRYWFGIDQPAHVQGSHIRYTSRGMSFHVHVNGQTYSFTIPAFGKHNVYNALAAIGICYAMGFSMAEIQKGLAMFKQPHMRLQLVKGVRGTLLINDAWNANPTSMIAGLNVLNALSGKRKSIAVLGDMKELGSYTQQAYNRVGDYIARHPVDQLVTVGRYANLIARRAVSKGFNPQKVVSFRTREAALRHLLRAPSGSVIYFKASRSLHFEKLVKQLKAR